jgi:quercetin dioxygenase-like cupin family protein
MEYFTSNKMENAEFEKSKIFSIENEVEYVPHSIISRTIIKKPTGNIKALSFDAGEGLAEKVSPFDIFTQIIDGKAELVIDGESKVLEKGQSVIIPAHTPNYIRAAGRFKMISTVIKSGYDI